MTSMDCLTGPVVVNATLTLGAVLLGSQEQHVMMVGYIGSGFSGYQASNEAGIKTVQGELIKALDHVGALASRDPTGWHQSSRTDKGVYAAQLLIQACAPAPCSLEHHDKPQERDQ